MASRASVAALALFVAAVMPACVTKPVVSVDRADLGMPTFVGLPLDVALVVRNKNAFDVAVRNVRGTPSFLGVPLAPLDLAYNVWLPAGQTTTVHVPVTVPWGLVVTALPPLLLAKGDDDAKWALAYGFKGTADVTATRLLGIERNDYPVDESGRLDPVVACRTIMASPIAQTLRSVGFFGACPKP